jgi:cyclopropane-fatty-acyl-phospholipid synthase
MLAERVMTTPKSQADQGAAGQESPPRDQIGASPEAISAHYDVGEEFFQLWLGPELVYSCAMFDGTDDLATAQRRKLDFHIEAAGAAGAGRVLDIGCGWGALLQRLVEHAGVETAIGLTLSPSQAAWIRRASRPEIEVREEHWRDHKPIRPYDAIISIGAFEHFVHSGLDEVQKLQAYREFFAFCDQALVSRGRLSLQTIACPVPLRITDPFGAYALPFISEKIFRESDLPLIWEPIRAAEGKFELRELRNDGEHYYRTLRLWEQSLMARRAEAVALVGEATVAEFRRYLRLSAAGFKAGVVCLLRMSFVKRD